VSSRLLFCVVGLAGCGSLAATRATDGQCASANAVPAAEAPAADLCRAGTPSPVRGTGPWTWTCAGTNGGAQVQCVAPLAASAWRIVSMPDFLNADIADLSTLSTYDGGANSTNGWHETAVSYVLDQVADEKPDFVLVAGDLVNGHWYDDADHRAIFGPCTDVETKRASVQKAGDFYYARWRQRMDERGLVFHAAVGDHDIGDNPWPAGDDRSSLLPTYRSVYASYITRSQGVSRYDNRPTGTPYADTAYAFQHRNVLVVTVDVFHQSDPSTQLSSEGTVEMVVEGDQLDWLKRVLAHARADSTVDHVIVQGHLPVLWPVRGQSSSMMHMAGGAASPFWQALKDYGVTLYLAGEVHDMTAAADGGVDQIVHGGIMGYAPNTNYLLINVDGKRLDLTLKRLNLGNDPSQGQLWQMNYNRPNAKYEVDPAGYQVVGTLTIDTSSGHKVYANRTGYFEPYVP
jgi:3',5'-cyclic AMP phosphodiesterase CpdA